MHGVKEDSFSHQQKDGQIAKLKANQLRLLATSLNTKSPQIVRLRLPICRTNFPAGNHNANPLTTLVHLFGASVGFDTVGLCAQCGKGESLVARWKIAASNRKLSNDFTTPINTANTRLTPKSGDLKTPPLSYGQMAADEAKF